MVQILKNKKVKVIICLMIILIMLVLTMKQSYAAGDVSSVIQQAWKQMESQIKNIVNNVVFPVIDIILAVFFFAKLAMAYFDYRKQGQFDWTTPAILFACLTFSLIAPNYIWNVFLRNRLCFYGILSQIRSWDRELTGSTVSYLNF